eukprot:TRINITY_DN8307_c0_g1_i1.p1 TRINITY_DN8307_c0_g1~~TRINITY_DN8307_c0_g1_i1.p1  ORF type:complete len:371 (+),score=41.32 TRINITY_DN8307_c0_g1_i1:541-1653(+)
MSEFVHIDGAYGEGGGQVLRNTVALAALMNKPIKVTDIRKNRKPKPGLRPQHLAGIQLVSQMYQGKLSGGAVDSSEISFVPGQFRQSDYVSDTGTAGSITLLMQISIPCLTFASKPTTVKFIGGTNADKAPQIDYFHRVFGPISSKFGLKYEFSLTKRGFFPKGLGVAAVTVEPIHQLAPVVLEDPGYVKSIKIFSFVAGGIHPRTGTRVNDSALRILKQRFPEPSVEYDVQFVQETSLSSVGNGCGITIVAETSTGCLFGGSALLEQGKSGDDVGADAARKLITDFDDGGCVDEYAQDQIIIFMALAKGRSKIRSGPLSLHTQTSIHFSSLMTGAKFEVLPIPDPEKMRPGENSYWITCDGIGFENPHV